MSRTTTLLDGRKKVKMTGKVYLRAIVPIGVMFSMSLICGNLTYLYLSVSFIQMLKVSLYTVEDNPADSNNLVGLHASRCPDRRLGPCHRETRLQQTRQSLPNRHRRCIGICW